jgi:hypothetical protein
LALGEMLVLCYQQIVELAAIRIGKLTSLAHSGRAVVRGGVAKVPREERNR